MSVADRRSTSLLAASTGHGHHATRAAVSFAKHGSSSYQKGGGEGSTGAAERQRRHRQRLKAGRIPLSFEIDERVIEALLITGAITEAESLSRSAIEAALSEMIDDWTGRALVTA